MALAVVHGSNRTTHLHLEGFDGLSSLWSGHYLGNDFAINWDSDQGLKMICRAIQIKLYFVHSLLFVVTFYD